MLEIKDYKHNDYPLHKRGGWYLFQKDGAFLKLKDNIRVEIKEKNPLALINGRCYLGKLEFLSNAFYPEVLCHKFYEIVKK